MFHAISEQLFYHEIAVIATPNFEGATGKTHARGEDIEK
jgi:hypothetical protein